MSEWQSMVVSALVEALIAYCLAASRRWPCRGALHVAAASAAATAITHPQFWTAALWAYGHFGFWPSVLALEAVVVLVEGALIAWMAMLRLDRSMLVSFAANSGSFLVGLALNAGASKLHLFLQRMSLWP